jgi:AcrR family transcriptional regulator
MTRRQYTMLRRAAQQEETRRRIAEAAAALHETVGPARTTISAVAERAGVQRLTVYRHFPDEEALFQACSSHWLAQHPPPDLTPWQAEGAAVSRLERALEAMYAYYEQTAAMWERAYRDGPVVPALHGPLSAWFDYLEQARTVVLSAFDGRGRARARLGAAIGHALAFETWRSLTARGLTRREAVDLMGTLVRAAAGLNTR